MVYSTLQDMSTFHKYKLMIQQTLPTGQKSPFFIAHAGSPKPDENTILMPVEERTGKMESTVHPTSVGVQHSIQPQSQVMYILSL